MLPADFLQLARRTHSTFDTLATIISAGAERDTVVSRLAHLTSTCIACHVTWQLEVAH